MKFLGISRSLKDFSEVNLPEPVSKALLAQSILKPTAVQGDVLFPATEGLDIIAVAQTGSGKTLAFALPVLIKLTENPAVRALILAPSREMAQQIFKVFESLIADLDLSMAIAIGGVPSAKQTTKLNRKPRILIATPGRLNDHLLTNKLLLQDVEVLVVDEADRMLDMGFAPQLKSIQATMRGPRQTMMFSASFDDSVKSIAKIFMRDEVTMVRSEMAEAPVASLKQKVVYLGREQKHDRLLDELNATKGGVIVFCGSQASCEDVAEYLKDYGVSVGLIHGGLTQGNRNRAVREFRDEDLRVLVATDLLARGLDVPHVDHVINFDLPFQGEDFLHRIGRTARAGRSGHAITFVTESDDRVFKKIKSYLEGADEVVVTEGENLLAEPRLAKRSKERPVKKERTDKYKEKARPKHASKSPVRRRK